MSLTDLAIWGAGGVLIIGGVANIFGTAHSRYEVGNQTAVYRDVNGDGVPDKIVKRLGEDNSPPFMPKNLGVVEEVLYGVRVNGKTIYLTEQQFNGSQ